jgi:hypothetical protein
MKSMAIRVTRTFFPLPLLQGRDAERLNLDEMRRVGPTENRRRTVKCGEAFLEGNTSRSPSTDVLQEEATGRLCLVYPFV